MLEFLKPLLNENLTSEQMEEEIRQYETEIRGELKPFVEQIKNGKSKEEVCDEIAELCDNEQLLEILIQMLEKEITPYCEMQFLRELSLEQFETITQYILENAIIHIEEKEELMKCSGLDSQHILLAVKLLNTVLSMIIYERNTFRLFSKRTFAMFRFNEERIKILWNLYTSQKEELQNVALMKNVIVCRNIAEDLQLLVNSLKDLGN